MKAPLYSKEGKKKREIVLNPAIYAARVNRRLLELVHNAYAANLRHGTADTKTRKEVRGGGKKPWKQKGTGRARVGSIRSPLWRGGGTVFGPQPRSYYVSLPESMRKQALISAFSQKGSEKQVMVLEDFDLQSGKTKEWAEVAKALPLNGKKALYIINKMTAAFRRASQNMEKWIEIVEARNVNAYDVLQRQKICIAEAALPVIEERLLNHTEKASRQVKPDGDAS